MAHTEREEQRERRERMNALIDRSLSGDLDPSPDDTSLSPDEMRAIASNWRDTTQLSNALHAAAFKTEKLVVDLARAVYIAEHLHQMVPREVWREHGVEWMGQYEGDYHAEKLQEELAALCDGVTP